MKFTIELMREDMVIEENRKTVRYKGYAFMDEFGSCIIIVYGDARKNLMFKYLSEDTDDTLHIKYKCIDLIKK